MSSQNVAFPTNLVEAWERFQLVGVNPLDSLLYVVCHARLDHPNPFRISIWRCNPNLAESWSKVWETKSGSDYFFAHGFSTAFSTDFKRIGILNNREQEYDVHCQMTNLRFYQGFELDLPEQTLAVFVEVDLASGLMVSDIAEFFVPRLNSARFGRSLVHSKIGWLSFHDSTPNLSFFVIDSQQETSHRVAQTLPSVNINSAVQSVLLTKDRIYVLVERETMMLHVLELKDNEMDDESAWQVLDTNIGRDDTRDSFLLGDADGLLFVCTFSQLDDDTQNQQLNLSRLSLDDHWALTEPFISVLLDLTLQMSMWSWFTMGGLCLDAPSSRLLVLPERFPMLVTKYIQPPTLKQLATAVVQKASGKQISLRCYDWMFEDPLWCVPPLKALRGGMSEEICKGATGYKGEKDLFAH